MGSLEMLSRRTLGTDMPVMAQIRKLMAELSNPMSLAQGVVHWQPPQKALDKVKELVSCDPTVSSYGPDEGIPELREALKKKLREENKLTQSAVMVTAGANQAFVNLVLILSDPGDSVVMFQPYYFNAYMAFQMTGVTNIIVGPAHPHTLYPDADWLERTLCESKPTPKVVTVVNPGNPSGTYVPEPLLNRISKICKDAGCWLIVDNTYEYFMYDGLKHCCVEGDHIVNVFSFSKTYGMMGWRLGYIAYSERLQGFARELVKIQDNIPICASIVSQRLALNALEEGAGWIEERVKGLVKNREIVKEALEPLGKESVKGGEGAIYLWAKLPEEHRDDFKVVTWLAHRHGVVGDPRACKRLPGACPGLVWWVEGGRYESSCREAEERLRGAGSPWIGGVSEFYVIQMGQITL